MGGEYDAVNDMGQVAADGFGWGTIEQTFDAPPAGTNRALYLFKGWFDTFLVNTNNNETNTWKGVRYHGLSFDGVGPDTQLNTAPEAYDNFFGSAGRFSSETNSRIYESSDSNKIAYYGVGVSGSDHIVYDGNGGDILDYISSDPTHEPYGLPFNPTLGAEATFAWEFFTSEFDDKVYHRAWVNRDSIDLKNLDLTSIDPDNPEATIPIAGSYLFPVTQINGDVAGTNWRPSTGVMGFPTHFMARYGHSTQKLVFDSVRVLYSSLNIV